MLYIYTFKDLNPKSAEIEALNLIRDVRRNVRFPVQKEYLKGEFSRYFGTMEDINVMTHALKILPEVMLEIVNLPKIEGLYEVISLQRAYTGLNEVIPALEKNVAYTKELIEWQDTFAEELAESLNMIPTMETIEQKKKFDLKAGGFFEKILRNNINFMFNHYDIINEAHVARLNDIQEILNEGAFFHFTLEEHLRHLNFNDIKRRIPQCELNKVDEVTRKINVIKKGVEIAYQNNFKVMEMSILLYSYIMGLKQYSK
jgi:hypothetical protein